MPIGFDIAKNALRAVPWVDRHRTQVRLAAGYDPEKDHADYMRAVFETHASEIQKFRPIRGDVLEIGPGGNVGTALLFLAAGAAKAVCIDVVPWATLDHRLYESLVPNATDLYEHVEYRCPDAIESTCLQDRSFDIIYSHACLEHVREPTRAAGRIAELLVPGGITCHQIDLRDHRDFSRPLDFLRFSDRTWNWAVSRRGYTNRLRRSDWIAAFSDAGLEVLEARTTNEIPMASVDASRFAPAFTGRDAEDLGAVGLLLLARKPKAHADEPVA
jgi:SAM-dependent methyltransferase